MASNGGFKGSVGLLILRVGMAAMLFAGHGWGKITHFGEMARTFPDPLHVGHTASLGLVVLAEVFCTLFVAFGLFTRIAVVPIVGFLGVAGFIQLAAEPWSHRELAFVYLAPFVALFFTAAGRLSVDGMIARRRGE